MVIDGRVIEDILYIFVNDETFVQCFDDGYEATRAFMEVAVSVPAVLYNVDTKVCSCNSEGYRIKAERGI